MDFTPQHVMELIQDPRVFVLALIGVLLGIVLCRFRSPRTEKPHRTRTTAPPARRFGRRTMVPCTDHDLEDGHRTSPPKPSIPETPPPEELRPAAVSVEPPPVTAAVLPSYEPVLQPTPIRMTPVLEPVASPVIEARIHTRTGDNTSKVKLIDPYEESERVWSEAETARAVALYRSGKSLVPIALAMKIDQRQVAIRLIRILFTFDGELEDMKSAPRHGKKYSDEEVSKIQSYSDAGSSIQDIATAVERTVLGVGWWMLDRRMI